MPFSLTSSFSLHLCSHRLLHSMFHVFQSGTWLTDGWWSLELGVESPVSQAACFEAVRDGRRLCISGGHLAPVISQREVSAGKEHREWCVLDCRGFSSLHLVSLCFWTGEEDVWVFWSTTRIPTLSPWLFLGVLAFLGWNLFVVHYGLFMLLNFSGKNWDPEWEPFCLKALEFCSWLVPGRYWQ